MKISFSFSPNLAVYGNHGIKVGNSATEKYVIWKRVIITIKTQLIRNQITRVPAAAYTDLLSEIPPTNTHSPQQIRKKIIPNVIIAALPNGRFRANTQTKVQIPAIIRLSQLHFLASLLNIIEQRIAAEM